MKSRQLLNIVVFFAILAICELNDSFLQDTMDCKKTVEKFRSPITWQVNKEIITIVPCDKEDCPVKKKGFDRRS